MELACDYERSAQLLSSKIGHESASSLLKVLAFEIGLKATYLYHHSKLPTATGGRGHDYWSIWNEIPAEAREASIDCGRDRFAGHVSLDEPEKVLKELQNCFSKGRYSYEKNLERTQEEVARVSREWLENGSLEGQADFQYFPMERDALFHGIRAYLETKLGISFHLDS